MKRIQLFEFTDQAWYPQLFRHMQTDYLQFVTTRGTGHRNLIPLFQRALEHAGTRRIIDLCSGAGGPWMRLYAYLKEAGIPVQVTLTDNYPTPQVIEKYPQDMRSDIEYLAEPIDAREVPRQLKGMRTLFEGFHHFEPKDAYHILRDATEDRVAIGIFEASLKPPQGPLILALSPLMTLLGYFFVTPWIKPRTWQRFLWTYLLPIVPLVTCWDGVVSFLRVYSLNELKDLASSVNCEDYVWEIGQADSGTPLFIFTYLVGYPREQ